MRVAEHRSRRGPAAELVRVHIYHQIFVSNLNLLFKMHGIPVASVHEETCAIKLRFSFLFRGVSVPGRSRRGGTALGVSRATWR